jgi:DNA polymerase III gamma/tau subunit
LPEQRATVVADQARKLGASTLVRSIEVLGESLIEMRHAPDARLLLEVSLVKLTNQTLGGDIAAIIGRLERLEAGVVRNTDATGPVAKPAPVNPATGRVQVGGKARMPQSNPAPVAAQPTSAPQPTAPTAPVTQTQPATPASDSQVVAKWPEILTGLKPFVRALYSAVTPQACTETTLTLAAPNEMHMKKAQEQDWSFLKSVLGEGDELGVYTVPGDGMVDYVAVFEALKPYSGWVILEAEQDPKKAPSLAYAKKGVAHLKAALKEAGLV